MPWGSLTGSSLSPSSARALVASKHRGVVAISMRALPMAFPISYAVIEQELILRTSSVGILLPQLDGQVVTIVAQDDSPLGDERPWLVAVTGRAHAVADRELLDRCRALELPASGSADVFLRIPMDIVTGYGRVPPSNAAPCSTRPPMGSA